MLNADADIITSSSSWLKKTDDGNLHVDHALNITFPTAFSSSMERTVSNALKSLDKACCNLSRSITIVGYAAAAYLLMAGISRLIDVTRSSRKSLPSSHAEDSPGK